MPNAPRVKWYGKRVAAKVKRGTSRNVLIAAEKFASDVRAHFPASGQAGTRSGGGDAGNRSAPGEIPHVQTGQLKRNIGVQKRGETSARVGTGIGNKESVGYAVALEKGTRDMAARPYLRPGLKRNKRMLEKTIGGKVI
jgi:HK97 gp10 family phage protein